MENDKEMSEQDSKVTQEANNDAALGNNAVEETNAMVEENHEDHEQADDSVDFSDYSKTKLIHALKDLLKSESYVKNDGTANDIKHHFEDIHLKEKQAALELFVAGGGLEDDFAYRGSEEDKEFFVLFHDFKEKKGRQQKEAEKAKEKNAQAKNSILDKLRELVDSEETTSSIDAVKAIQEEWKRIGPVPSSQGKNLWASYNALMDRFYDNRSIYFELKELDRKKNLESKLELCEKAEGLAEVDDLKEAIRELNEFHEEFKHIGPVPRDEQDQVWQRFKTASDAVYARRKDFYEQQKVVLTANLEIKLRLIDKLSPIKDFKADRIKDWNVKTKEVLSIQKEWETIGAVPRENGREVNKTFWGLFKQFFNNKSHFFKELDETRKRNKDRAEELIRAAEKHKVSTDWKESSGELINLQKEWKSLGPMPEKLRDDLYNRFKSACDEFFQSRRNSNKEADQEYEDNLGKKQALCVRIEEEAESKSELTVEKLEGFIQEFNEIGFVPRKDIKEIGSRFSDAVDRYVENLGVEGQEKEEFLFRLNLNKIQNDPNSARVLNKKEHGIRKQIADLENNITLWKNNMEFFAASKTADKLKDQFDDKIQKAEQEVDRLKKKLSIIREF